MQRNNVNKFCFAKSNDCFLSPVKKLLVRRKCNVHITRSRVFINLPKWHDYFGFMKAESQNTALVHTSSSSRVSRFSYFFFPPPRAGATSITLIKPPTRARITIRNNSGPFRRPAELSHGGAFQVGSLPSACNLRRRWRQRATPRLHRTWQ